MSPSSRRDGVRRRGSCGGGRGAPCPGSTRGDQRLRARRADVPVSVPQASQAERGAAVRDGRSARVEGSIRRRRRIHGDSMTHSVWLSHGRRRLRDTETAILDAALARGARARDPPDDGIRHRPPRGVVAPDPVPLLARRAGAVGRARHARAVRGRSRAERTRRPRSTTSPTALVETADRIRSLPLVDRLRETDPELFSRYILERLGTSQRGIHAEIAARVSRGPGCRIRPRRRPRPARGDGAADRAVRDPVRAARRGVAAARGVAARAARGGRAATSTAGRRAMTRIVGRQPHPTALNARAGARASSRRSATIRSSMCS